MFNLLRRTRERNVIHLQLAYDPVKLGTPLDIDSVRDILQHNDKRVIQLADSSLPNPQGMRYYTARIRTHRDHKDDYHADIFSFHRERLYLIQHRLFYKDILGIQLPVKYGPSISYPFTLHVPMTLE